MLWASVHETLVVTRGPHKTVIGDDHDPPYNDLLSRTTRPKRLDHHLESVPPKVGLGCGQIVVGDLDDGPAAVCPLIRCRPSTP